MQWSSWVVVIGERVIRGWINRLFVGVVVVDVC